MRSYKLLFIFIVLSKCLLAQDSIQKYRKEKSILDYSPTENKGRIIALSSTMGLVYSGAMIGLNELWYVNYPRSSYHLFEDSGEWLQIDKCGHAHSAYSVSQNLYHVFRWMGLNQKKSAVFSSLTGFLAISSIEIYDGFSAEYGASLSDLGANAFGSVLALSQNLAWGQQRIQMKQSVHLDKYPGGDLGTRAKDLYGSSLIERAFKDYNNINIWLSVNPAKFTPKWKHAKWISFAVGYGAGNLYGGYTNVWTTKDGIKHDYSNVKRYRKFFISVDYDLTQIKTRSRVLKATFNVLNMIKLPAPAIEFNTLGQVIVHPIYFLNLDIPFYLKK